MVYERKAVDSLSEKDLDRVKDAGRNAKVVETLRAWIAAGKPKDAPPLSPKGDPIRKVSLVTNKKVDVLVRDGAADRGEMVRVDVFRKKNRRGTYEFFLVPIYPHQVADKEQWPMPPNRAVTASTPEADWPEMTRDYDFIWSLNQHSFVEIEKSDGLFIDGYFKGLDRFTGNINVAPHNNLQAMIRGIGPRRLVRFSKMAIDRLGNRHEIQRETRTWRGVACT
ncbi:MAG: hypothetical protein QM698_11425 [Micropepsaceae bacterium]